jgi:hypothetical protein
LLDSDPNASHGSKRIEKYRREPTGRLRCRWEDNIKMYLKKVKYEVVYYYLVDSVASE